MNTASDSDERDVESRIGRIMNDFLPAWIGPTEMWWQVLEALGPPGRASETLESLSPELKAQIREYYQAMQPTCYSDYLARTDSDESRALLCSRMIEWCERGPDKSAS